MAHGLQMRLQVPSLLVVVTAGPRRRTAGAEARNDGRQHALHAQQVLLRRHGLLDHRAELFGFGPGLDADSSRAGTLDEREPNLVPHDRGGHVGILGVLARSSTGSAQSMIESLGMSDHMPAS